MAVCEAQYKRALYFNFIGCVISLVLWAFCRFAFDFGAVFTVCLIAGTTSVGLALLVLFNVFYDDWFKPSPSAQRVYGTVFFTLLYGLVALAIHTGWNGMWLTFAGSLFLCVGVPVIFFVEARKCGGGDEYSFATSCVPIIGIVYGTYLLLPAPPSARA